MIKNGFSIDSKGAILKVNAPAGIGILFLTQEDNIIESSIISEAD